MTAAPPEVSIVRGREHIDFHYVEPHQRDMHQRLENWARWCRGRGAPVVSPMFRLCQGSARSREDYGAPTVTMVDKADAVKIHRALADPSFPERHRHALQWCYVRPISPKTMAARLGTNFRGLYDLLRDARQMLINRTGRETCRAPEAMS